MIRAGEVQEDLGVCQWFAFCVRPASSELAHPILGAVPVCPSCRRFARADQDRPKLEPCQACASELHWEEGRIVGPDGEASCAVSGEQHAPPF